MFAEQDETVEEVGRPQDIATTCELKAQDALSTSTPDLANPKYETSRTFVGHPYKIQWRVARRKNDQRFPRP